ncbi:brain-enriched guanylate kinase-associated protein [Neocloeon triangulifer]|uniref:brain-enriched guanylate kinase-associated protein n=1 Tax=Neocloeon triangulifer TaxID=2078957 RepID=UPI00286F30AE|nr:brain-enriched guanylate kinase-associated protein [Neocloeon triangulifer]
MAYNIRRTCKECGCRCEGCNDNTSLHLHVEIENLQQRLLEKEHHIVKMETNFLSEADKYPDGEVVAMMEEVAIWQDKYNRLYEAHKKLQKVNQGLEDKLLRIVDKFETEKSVLSRELGTTTRSLSEERIKTSRLKTENERYRNDVNLTIQLLQCKPGNFMPQKFDSLPSDIQQKVKTYVNSKRPNGGGNVPQNRPEPKVIKVPIPTFPPTAMVYSVNKGESNGSANFSDPEEQPVDIVSAAIMAKVLEERERERSLLQHCESCRCPTLMDTRSRDVATQTSDHVSVTVLPANHSNILLDNMVGYRSPHNPMLGSSCRSAVLVHSPRGRNNSTSSGESQRGLGDMSETETDI